MNTPDNIAAAIASGAAGVTAKDRALDVKVTVRGVETVLPYAFTAQGNPQLLKEAFDEGQRVADRTSPLRQGRYQFSDLASILAWAARYKIAETSAYLQAPTTSAGSLTIVVDDLPTGDRGTTRSLRAHLPIELHDRLKAWSSAQNTWTDASVFCSFIEMAGDELTSADLLSMVQNLEVTGATLWKRTVDDKGAVRVQTEDKSGPATRIPREFEFAVPAFDFDTTTTVFNAKLFSKIEKGQPLFQFKIADLKRTIAISMTRTRDAVAGVLPSSQVYLGVAP